MPGPQQRLAQRAEQLLSALLRDQGRGHAREQLACLDEEELLALLRLPVPVAFLEEVGASGCWQSRPRVLARVVLHPKAPVALALRLVAALAWRDLAEVAATMRLNGSVRYRAEALLRDSLPDMRLGDRVCLARLATPALLPALLGGSEPLVVQAALLNPRLREADLVTLLRGELASPTLLELAADCPRWQSSYAVRQALATQPRTPLSVALHQLSGLLARDLRQVSQAERLVPLLRLTAERLLQSLGPDRS